MRQRRWKTPPPPPSHRDPHQGGGEEIHQTQFISEDELLSQDATRGSYSTPLVYERTRPLTDLPAFTTSCSCPPSLQTDGEALVIEVRLGHRLSNLQRLVGVAVTEVKTHGRGNVQTVGQVWRP